MKQAETARTVYRSDILSTLHGRQLFVRQQLMWFLREYHRAPTGLELVRYAAAQWPERHIDVNTIRPRLHEMNRLGWVKHGAKRRCDVSGKNVWTWELSDPHVPLPEPIPQRLQF